MQPTAPLALVEVKLNEDIDELVTRMRCRCCAGDDDYALDCGLARVSDVATSTV
jgi:hypothetical protein